MFDLAQHVTESAHPGSYSGLISKGLSLPLVNVVLALSDQVCVCVCVFFFIIGWVGWAGLSSQCKTVCKGDIDGNTNTLLKKAIAMTPSITAECVDDRLNQFNFVIFKVTDSVAPNNVKKIFQQI